MHDPGNTACGHGATDDRGNTQPVAIPFNEQGYLYGAIVGHPITVR